MPQDGQVKIVENKILIFFPRLSTFGQVPVVTLKISQIHCRLDDRIGPFILALFLQQRTVDARNDAVLWKVVTCFVGMTETFHVKKI